MIVRLERRVYEILGPDHYAQLRALLTTPEALTEADLARVVIPDLGYGGCRLAVAVSWSITNAI